MIWKIFFYRRKCDGLKIIQDELENKINNYLKLFVILYTDDTVLMTESVSELLTLLDTFYRYCITWKMKEM